MESSRIVALPLYWFLAASVLCGAAASRATRRVSRRRASGEPDTTVKWVLVCVYFTAAVVCVTIGLLAAAAKSFLNRSTLVMCTATAGLAFASFRFRRAVGGPVFLLVVAAALASVLLTRALVAFAGETEIATVRILARGDRRMTLELVPAGRPPAVVELRGDYFAPVVKVVVFDDLLVFLGSKTWYRFEGLTSFSLVSDGGSQRLQQEPGGYAIPRAPGLPEAIYSLFEKWEGSIPGVKAVQVEMDLKRVPPASGSRPLDKYSIRVQSDGGVLIVPVR